MAHLRDRVLLDRQPQRGSSYSSNAIQAAAIAAWPGPMPRKRETSTTMPTSGVEHLAREELGDEDSDGGDRERQRVAAPACKPRPAGVGCSFVTAMRLYRGQD